MDGTILPAMPYCSKPCHAMSCPARYTRQLWPHIMSFGRGRRMLANKRGEYVPASPATWNCCSSLSARVPTGFVGSSRRRSGHGRISPSAGQEHATPWPRLTSDQWSLKKATEMGALVSRELARWQHPSDALVTKHYKPLDSFRLGFGCWSGGWEFNASAGPHAMSLSLSLWGSVGALVKM